MVYPSFYTYTTIKHYYINHIYYNKYSFFFIFIEHVRKFTEKHDIEMSNIMNNKLNNLYNSWNDFTNVLKEAAIMLKEKQEEFQNIELANQEEFQEDVKRFWEYWIEYKERSSKNEELKAIGLYKKRANQNLFSWNKSCSLQIVIN